MSYTDYIDLSKGLNGFEGLVPSFLKNMGEEYMTGKRDGATDYLEVIDCEAVKDYIEKEVETPKYEGQFASFEGFVLDKALNEDNPPVPPIPPVPSTPTILYLSDGTTVELYDTVLTDAIVRDLYSGDIYGADIGTGVIRIDNMAFYNCKQLEFVHISDTVKEIGDDAFNMCMLLSDVTIGNGVESIGLRGFAGCIQLCLSEIPGNVKTIGKSAFNGNYFEDTSLYINEGVESIGERAFSTSPGLQEVYFPSTLKFIGTGVLDMNPDLQTITFAQINSGLTNALFNTKAQSGSVDITVNIESVAYGTFFGDYDISSLLNKGTSKGTHKYSIFTDNQIIKEQMCVVRDSYTIVDIYHLDGTPWDIDDNASKNNENQQE